MEEVERERERECGSDKEKQRQGMRMANQLEPGRGSEGPMTERNSSLSLYLST